MGEYIEGYLVMVAIVASLLFTIAFLGSVGLMAYMLFDRRDTILSALQGNHVPAGFKPSSIVVNTPRHAPRLLRKMAPPPSLSQIRRAAVA